MESEIFADFVGGVALMGSIVRLDLVSISPADRDEKDQPKASLRVRVVMPVEGFVRSFAVMTRVMEQLEKQGAIKRNSAAEPQVSLPAAPQSANFK